MDATKTGDLIKTIRTEKNMTQDELAKRIHVTRSAVSRWERGLGLPEVSILEDLADVLDISVVELMHGERESVVISNEQDLRELSRNAKEEVTDVRKGFRCFFIGALVLIAVICLLASIYSFRRPVFTLIDHDAYEAVYHSNGGRFQIYSYEYINGKIKKSTWYGFNTYSTHHFFVTQEGGIRWEDNHYSYENHDEKLIPMQYASSLKCSGEEQILAIDAGHDMNEKLEELTASNDPGLHIITVVYSCIPK